MDVIDHWTLFEQFLQCSKKYGVLLSCSSDNPLPEEVEKAAPGLSRTEYILLASGDKMYAIFDTYHEANAFFWKVVGDDGPTQNNPYNGPVRVFACMGGPEGIITENT